MPRAYAEKLYAQLNNDDDPNNNISEEDKEQFLADNSFNTTTWEEVLTLPESKTGDERYYAVSIGDVRVIVLEVARIWRGNSGRQQEQILRGARRRRIPVRLWPAHL